MCVQRPKAPQWRVHIAVNALYLGFQFQEAALFAIVMPVLLLDLVPETYVVTLAALATVSTLAGTLTPSVAGWLSDRGKRAHISRRTQTAAIIVIDVIALSTIALTHSLAVLTVAVIVAALCMAGGETVYQAILPDVVPRGEWGASTGTRGTITLIGAVVGLLLAGRLPPALAIIANAGLLAFTALSLIFIPPDLAEVHEEAHPTVGGDRRDFFITIVLRAFVVLGLGLFTTYALYFFRDILAVSDAPWRTGLTAIAALLGAMVSSILSGMLSDQADRRYIVAAAACVMAFAGFGFALERNADVLVAFAALFGIGLGAVFSAGYALTLSTLPNPNDFGRDLGAWSTVSGLPAIAAPPIGAFVLSSYDYTDAGFQVLFIIASTAFLLCGISALFVRPIIAAPTPAIAPSD
jgi:MFS family permease